MRLVVDQSGMRIHDERMNILTVVANESYVQYVERLQLEVEEEYGKDGAPPTPPNARKRGKASIRKEYTLKPEFKELWERIKCKTQYAVRIDTEQLIKEVVSDLDSLQIKRPRVTITKAEVAVGSEDLFEALQMSATKTVRDLVGRYPLPNVVEIMETLMRETTPPMFLTRRTLLEIIRQTKNKEAVIENPHDFAAATVRRIKNRLVDHLVDGIQYKKLNEWYEMSLLETKVETWKEHLIPASRSVYDHVIFDSNVEKEFVEGLENNKAVRMYLKLPGWFKVTTPVGDYNPDWAIIMEDRDEHGKPTGKSHLYLVRETKGKDWKTTLRPNELRKIKCGKSHFEGALKVDYKVVTKASELP